MISDLVRNLTSPIQSPVPTDKGICINEQENSKNTKSEDTNYVKVVKYETLIEDINFKLATNTTLFDCNTALALIYDYDKCNKYGKIIMDKSRLFITAKGRRAWQFDHGSYNEFKDLKRRINGAKEFIQSCREEQNMEERYKFIFWALMILTVDKTDEVKHLSLICDFAKMLYITDDEFEDIIQVIKIIYDEFTSDYVFKSENVPLVLGVLFNLNVKQPTDSKVERKSFFGRNK